MLRLSSNSQVFKQNINELSAVLVLIKLGLVANNIQIDLCIYNFLHSFVNA